MFSRRTAFAFAALLFALVTFSASAVAQIPARIAENAPAVCYPQKSGLFIKNAPQVTPPGAPTVAEGAAGNPNGAYTYKVTFVNAFGETSGGTTSASITVASKQISLTAIPLGPTGTTARKIYRTAAGGSDGTQKLVTTIADNTTAVYTDNTADGSLGATVPVNNLTGAVVGVFYCAAYATDGSGWKRVPGTFTGTAAASKLAKFSATLSPAAVAANTCAEQTFTVTGVETGDVVTVNKPTAQAGLGIGGVRASAANQVGVTFCNNTAGSITPTASQVYTFGAIQ